MQPGLQNSCEHLINPTVDTDCLKAYIRITNMISVSLSNTIPLGGTFSINISFHWVPEKDEVILTNGAFKFKWMISILKHKPM